MQTADELVFLYEGGLHTFRIIPTDGRAHKKDPWTWNGEDLVDLSLQSNDRNIRVLVHRKREGPSAPQVVRTIRHAAPVYSHAIGERSPTIVPPTTSRKLSFSSRC